MKIPELPENGMKNSEEKQSFTMDVCDFEVDSLIRCEEDITKKTVPYIEKMVRNSFEYRSYINYLKNELDITKCSFVDGLDCNDVGISLEFHHFPLNLYEISEVVLNSKLDNLPEDSDGVSLFDVSEEIVKMHYMNNIGLVPLSETFHKMAHNRALIIPIEKVYGNYRNFMKLYDQYIDDDIKLRVNDAEIYNNSEEAEEFNSSKLEKRINEYNITYFREDEEDSNEDEQ